MIPYRVTPAPQKFPTVTLTLIAIQIAIFVYMLTLSSVEKADFIEQYGITPTAIDTFLKSMTAETSLRPLLQCVTSLFINNGGILLFLNLIALSLFGESIEARQGSIRFLIFYFLCGLVALFAHIGIHLNSHEIVLGPQGAIAGVLGASLLFQPKSRVQWILPIPFLWRRGSWPAWFVLLGWFGIQAFILSTEPWPPHGLGHWSDYVLLIAGALTGIITFKLFEKKR